MRLTDYFIQKTDRFKKEPEPHDARWSKLNAESPEMEVCEFLYCLVRLVKPERVLETGGGTGNSGAYIAQGLKENEKGYLTCLEPYPTSYRIAEKLWDDLGVRERIDFFPLTSFDFSLSATRFQLMFLDSEPSCRFSEVKKFYSHLDPGGIILIHDLKHEWGGEWEDFKPLFGDLLKNFSLQVVSLETPRGLAMFQKVRSDSTYYQFLKNQKGGEKKA